MILTKYSLPQSIIFATKRVVGLGQVSLGLVSNQNIAELKVWDFQDFKFN